MSQLPNIDSDFLLKKRINKTAFKDSDLLKYIPFPVSLIREAFHYSSLHASLDCATSFCCKDAVYLYYLEELPIPPFTVPTLNPPCLRVVRDIAVLSLKGKVGSGLRLAAGAHQPERGKWLHTLRGFVR